MSLVFGRSCLRHVSSTRRAIHSTRIALKKKAKPAFDRDDLFGDFSEDLISTEGASTVATTAGDASVLTSASKQAKQRPQKRLTSEARSDKFNALYDIALKGTGKKPESKFPIRHSTWNHLLDLAQTPEDLEKVIELSVQWRAGGHQLNDRISDLFVRRCEQLKCPKLALKVYGNVPKYSLRLTLSGARQLMHSLHGQHDLKEVSTAVALYPIHNLLPVSQDLVSCSLVMNAFIRDGTAKSKEVVDALLPHLKALLASTPPRRMKPSQTQRSLPLNKAKLWLKWSLKKVDLALRKETGKSVDWLTTWRMANTLEKKSMVQI